MNKASRTLLCIMILLSFFTAALIQSNVFAATWPETVRVGIYYGKDAVSNVSYVSKSGLEVGYQNSSGVFVSLLAEVGGKATIIRKDAYFIKSATGVTTEYNPSEGVPFEGVTTGPFHIQIGEKAADYQAALSVIEMVKKSGITAYPVFENGWYVWTGFYSDNTKASEDLINLTNKLGTAVLSVIPPNSARLTIFNDSFEPRLIYGNNDFKLRIKPNAANDPYLLSVNGKQYRGEFEIRRYTDSDLTVINILPIEQYLYGVVPGELEASAPKEALKAQAVAARTYTYMSMNKYSKWSFDVVDTVDSQVYGGYDVEKPATNIAVNETSGIKVLYNGKLASLFYFSSSGGMTEDNINVWGNSVPYLKSVPDPYESGKSYNYSWTQSFTKEKIKQILFLSGVDIGDIVDVIAEERSEAQRVIKLKFVGTKSSITYYRADGRTLLGLPSQLYYIQSGSSSAEAVAENGNTSSTVLNGSKVVSATGTSQLTGSSSVTVVSSSGTSTLSTGNASGNFVFTGKGWGHAIGMSQEGAKGFALQGYTYDQILKHYFNGVTIE